MRRVRHGAGTECLALVTNKASFRLEIVHFFGDGCFGVNFHFSKSSNDKFTFDNQCNGHSHQNVFDNEEQDGKLQPSEAIFQQKRINQVKTREGKKKRDLPVTKFTKKHKKIKPSMESQTLVSISVIKMIVSCSVFRTYL